MNPFVDVNGYVINFPAGNNNSASFKHKQKITSKTADGGTKDVEMMVPLQYLSNFCTTLKMILINCEFNHILTWFKKVCFIMIQKKQHLE